MEMNRRRSRGFMIAKLMPFCKAVKPPTPSQDFYTNIHYTSSIPTSYAPQPDYNNYVTATTPKVSFLLQPSAADKNMEKRPSMMADNLTGRGLNGVDARAASYISSVRERFKLDHCERLATVISLDKDVDH